MIDYDPCDECHERGDDYYQDEDGDWMMRCYDCPLWEMSDEEKIAREYCMKHGLVVIKEPEKQGWPIVKTDGWNYMKSATDVVEVVRCKDCVHLETINGKSVFARCSRHDFPIISFGMVDTRTWFCADGERKSN